jgi:4-amino-4-deoxy-L-arabinose transferase-like glycosyltransferase
MSRLLCLVVICLILFSALTVYITIPKEEEFAKGADEGYYFLFANFIAKNGIKQFPSLIEHYVSNETAQLFPTPSRIGHILITALWLKVFPNNFVSLARFSFFCFVLFLIISFYFSKKYFSQDLAYLYVLLLSCSPLTMTLGRRALSDINANLFWALSVWFFLDFLFEKKKVKFIIFLLVYSLSIMIKESSIVLLLFFVSSFLLYKYKYKQNISNYYLLGIFLGPLFLVGMVYVFVLNGLGNVISLAKTLLNLHFGTGTQTSEYALLFCTGPWYRYIIDYLLLTPLTTILFIGYFFHILFSRKFDWKIMYFMIYFVIIFAVFSSARYTKVVRLVVNLDIVISLFATLALYELFRHKDKQRQTYLVLTAAVAIFFVNYFNFLYLFCNQNIYDPVSYLLLRAKKIIPYK